MVAVSRAAVLLSWLFGVGGIGVRFASEDDLASGVARLVDGEPPLTGYQAEMLG
jgi:hypothetical protein